MLSNHVFILSFVLLVERLIQLLYFSFELLDLLVLLLDVLRLLNCLFFKLNFLTLHSIGSNMTKSVKRSQFYRGQIFPSYILLLLQLLYLSVKFTVRKPPHTTS